MLGQPNSNTRRAAGLALLLVALAACALASLAIGSLDIPIGEVIAAFTAFEDSDAHTIVRELRVPRTEVGLLVGGALGACGALMQGVTRNPLAEPGILGINAGAAFAVVVAIFLLGVTSVAGYAWFALLGAGIAALLGRKKLQAPVGVDTTKQNIEEDVAWTKAHLPEPERIRRAAPPRS